MNTIAKATTAALLISNLALVACAEKEQTPGMPAAGTVLSLRMADYESAGQSLAGENEITDFKACIFEEDRMTHIYDNLQASGSGYALQLDSHSGTLYVLANTGNQIDLHGSRASRSTSRRGSSRPWRSTARHPFTSSRAA
ncbi:hypothetical protein [Alistipes sp. Marseille-P5061]|uniref:hypothetical protein n=1 Tax=Alistipes sp. Marseille-P5061 TaxID=2048242 RepID=UPI00320800EB